MNNARPSTQSRPHGQKDHVLRGCVRVEHPGGAFDVRGGQAVVTRAGERVRYSTPEPDGAEYVAICLPAFSPDAAGRDPEQ